MKKVGEIYQTENYSIFKRLSGNRGVEDSRVLSILKSIQNVGYIKNPIIVNEKYEVIDGQGRLEACKRLGLPVYFSIAEGAGIEECIAMNINQKNWKVEDYVNSYGELGINSYILLQQLLKRFQSCLGLGTIISIAKGKNSTSFKDLKDGSFSLSPSQFRDAATCLEYLKSLSRYIDDAGGNKDKYYFALSFCFRHPNIDNKMMADKIQRYRVELMPVSTMDQALDTIEEIYNKRARKKTYIKTEYQKAMEDKYSWYASKYLKEAAPTA